MILLLPIGLLLSAALAITILERFRPRFGTSWLIASASCIISWLVVFILRLRLPTTVDVLSWQYPDLNLTGQFSFLLDYHSWPYALALITITLAVILTDAARTRYDSSPRSWSVSLLITGLGLLALISGTSLSLMAALVVVDLMELVYLFQLPEADRFNFRIITGYAVRTASILCLLIGTLIGWGASGGFDLTEIPQSAGLLFLLAAILRLGVFPLSLPFLQDPELRRGTGNIIRLAPAAVSLSLLARLPVNLLTDSTLPWFPLFNGLLTVSVLYAAIRWVTADDEINGRPYWILCWAGLAVFSTLNGAPGASLAWGLSLLLPGSLLFLYFPRVQRMNFLQFFGLISLSGLPLTPTASGWAGLAANGITVWTFLLIIAHAIMVLGYLSRSLKPGGEAGALEQWSRIVFPLGLIIIIQASVTLGLIGWPGSFTIGVWWLALSSFLLVSAVIFLVIKYQVTPPYTQVIFKSNFATHIRQTMDKLSSIINLVSLYNAGHYINRLFAKVIRSISSLLEGEGGILWAVLLLLLMISVLTGGSIN
jgi:hypothetical protein